MNLIIDLRSKHTHEPTYSNKVNPNLSVINKRMIRVEAFIKVFINQI